MFARAGRTTVATRAVDTAAGRHGHGSWKIAVFIVSSLLIAFADQRSVEAGAADVYAIKNPTGPARRWGAGTAVTPYSQVNLQTGRVLTALPVVGWGGRGPGISLTLFHHQVSNWAEPSTMMLMGDANFDGHVNDDDLPDFEDILLEPAPTELEYAVADLTADAVLDDDDLGEFVQMLSSMSSGPVWSHTYDIALFFDEDLITMVWGDGTKDDYVWESGESKWVPPAGVFNALEEAESPASGWIVTLKNQSRLYFLEDGRLDAIEDASGNRVTCTYIDDAYDPADGLLDYVEDAAGRQLDFEYNSQGRLSQIHAPLGVTHNTELGDSATRTWTLLYDDTNDPGNPQIEGDGFFLALEDPLENRIRWEYTEDYDIGLIADQNEHAYGLEYDTYLGRIDTVSYPHEAEVDPLVVQFEYEDRQTLLVDVRGNPWTFKYLADSENLENTHDPFDHMTEFTYTASPAQLVHERATVMNALSNTWEMTYDDNGNVLTSTDPLGNRTRFEYDALNNLTLTEPPGATTGTGNTNKTVTIEYEDTAHPTSPTAVIEPPAVANGDPATTVMEYYTDDEAEAPYPEAWTGLVKSVTDPNGVVTLFDYDEWGQPYNETENPPVGEGGGGESNEYWPTILAGTTMNEGGVPVGGRSSQRMKPNCPGAPASTSTFTIDGNGYMISTECPEILYGICPIEPENPTPPSLLTSGCSTTSWSTTGNPLESSKCVSDPTMPSTLDDSHRNVEFDYDLFDRPISSSMTSNEATNIPGVTSPADVTRSFTQDYNDVDGVYTSTDQNGDSVIVELDDAGRTWRVTRSVGASPNTRSITAENSYDDAGRLVQTDLGNGNWIERDYDDANRLTRITHKHASGRTMLQLVYDWTPDGLIDEITETDNATIIGETITATVSYEYDYRNRLTREIRIDSGATGVAPVEFDIEYTYDLGGNRLSKVEHHTGRTTLYHYDVSEDPEDVGGQHNNRLLSQETYDDESEIVEQRWYRYGAEGHLSRLVRRVAGWADDAVYWFYYDTSGRLWLAVDGAGDYDAEEDELSDTVFGIAAEYRYDGGRQRYMVRLRDPNDDWAVMESVFRDYAGDGIHRDYTVDAETGDVTDGWSYLAGVGYDDAGANGPVYMSGDQIGSTRRLSDSTNCDTTCSPSITQRRIYSAFGEPIDRAGATADRYGYAGAYGYEEADANALDPLAQLGWLHVGERYYAPELGRFVQRDPIGIDGGLNTYEYVEGDPLLAVDPTGLSGTWGPNGPIFGAKPRAPLNSGKLRFGWSNQRVGYRAYQWRLALRYRGFHLYGASGVAGACILVAAATTVGIVGGRLIDNGFGGSNNGIRISDGLADFIYRRFYDDGSGYDPWGIGSW